MERQDALNAVWNAQPPPAHRNLFVMLRDRLASLAMLLVIGFLLMMSFLLNVAIAFALGAAGALLAVLIWVYYSAAILLLGAEFTKIYARRNGSQGNSVTPLQAG